MSSRNRVERPSIIIEKPISSVIHSSTVAVNGKLNEATVWPASDDDEDINDSILDQIQKIEDANSLRIARASTADADSQASPILVKRKQSTDLTDDKQPTQNSSTHVPVESKEKRHWSLLDCLDQNYFSESPNKIKRETIRCDISSTSTAHSSRTSNENSSKPNMDCCIEIESVPTIESIEAIQAIEKSHIDEETNETIRSQTDKLETLHVVSDPGSDTPSNSDSLSPDVIPGTPPSSEPYFGRTNIQRTLMDYFKSK